MSDFWNYLDKSIKFGRRHERYIIQCTSTARCRWEIASLNSPNEVMQKHIEHVNKTKHDVASMYDNGEYKDLIYHKQFCPTESSPFLMPDRWFRDLDWNIIRENILRRDGYACRYCHRHKPLRELHIHHLLDGKNGKYDNRPCNLLTLCNKCHGWWDAIRHVDTNDESKYIRLIMNEFGYEDMDIVTQDDFRHYIVKKHVCVCYGGKDSPDNRRICGMCIAYCHCNIVLQN